MIPVRVYAPGVALAASINTVRVNVTSKVAAMSPGEDTSDDTALSYPSLSPFSMGPVAVYPGTRAITALRMENGFQYIKLYQAHADGEGLPTLAHARWMLEGARADEPRRFPMGRGARALCVIWRNRRLDYVEARLRVYIPLYVEGICRDRGAREAFRSLRELYARQSDRGSELALYDYDGYDHVKSEQSLAQVVASPREMSHAFVLAALLEDNLIDNVRLAFETAGLGSPGVRDLPADISPLRPTEVLPNLRGGALVYYRPEFLNHMADRYFELFVPGGESKIPWERRILTMYGRECKEGHDTAFFGDPGTSYRYTGKDHVPLPWSTDPTGALGELLEVVRLVTGQPFNFCLMNLYGPKDSIGVHSDDERDLVPGASIFSISLGRARVFELGTGKDFRPAWSQRLAHGSALVMAGRTQSEYKHRVETEPMRKNETGPILRVNLTFRCIVVR